MWAAIEIKLNFKEWVDQNVNGFKERADGSEKYINSELYSTTTNKITYQWHFYEQK